ncbi:MAG TPA: hypothetical protein VF613_10685 [Longimicrobium sp.]|jgi:hypothetical protein
MKTALPLLALLSLALPAAAQRRPEPLVPARDTVFQSPRPRGTPETRIAHRTLTAAGGMAAGFFGGAALGATLVGATGSDSFLPMMLGAGGGAMILGGMGAGFPDYRGRCAQPERALRGALGGTVSTLAALLVISRVRSELTDGIALVGIPLGAAVAADC